MNDIELTLLTDNNAVVSPLEPLKKYSKKAALTDLAIATGGLLYDNKQFNIIDDTKLSGRVGDFWTQTCSIYTDHSIFLINQYGDRSYCQCNQCYPAIRPVLNSTSLFDYLYSSRTIGFNETYEVVYGEYPQMAVSSEEQAKLSNEYFRGNMKITRKCYNFNDSDANDYSLHFKPAFYYEFLYQNQKYIKVKLKTYNNQHVTLSNGEIYNSGAYVWIKVEPLTWLADTEHKLLISKKALLSGIRYSTLSKLTDDFKDSELYNYMNTYMVNEMFNTGTYLSNNENNIDSNVITKSEKPKEYPHINERMQEIKTRIKKLQSR